MAAEYTPIQTLEHDDNEKYGVVEERSEACSDAVSDEPGKHRWNNRTFSDPESSDSFKPLAEVGGR